MHSSLRQKYKDRRPASFTGIKENDGGFKIILSECHVINADINAVAGDGKTRVNVI